jgi:hypothetical protein
MQETKTISLPNGNLLEVTIHPGFLDIVAKQFEIRVEDIQDDHIRMYIFGAFKNAIDKAQNEGTGEHFT